MAQIMPANLLTLMRTGTSAWQVTFTSPGGTVISLHNYHKSYITMPLRSGQSPMFDLNIPNVWNGQEGYFSYWRGLDTPADLNDWYQVLGPGTQVAVKMGYNDQLVTVLTGYLRRALTKDSHDGYTIDAHGTGVMGHRLGEYKLRDASGSRTGTYSGTVEGFVAQAAQWMGYAADEIVTDLSGFSNLTIGYDNEVARSKFQALADNVGFRLKELRGGSLSFTDIPDPDVLTPVWTFEEGQDIQNVTYIHSTEDVYRTLKLKAYDTAGTQLTSTYTYNNADQYNIPAHAEWIAEYAKGAVKIDQAGLDKMALRMGRLMASKVSVISWTSLANPWLDLDDPVRVIATRSTVSDIYILDSMTLRLTPRGFLADYVARHYQPAV